MTLFRKSIFADVIKLRVLRRAHPGLFGWDLHPMMSVLIRDRSGEEADTEGKAMCRQRQGWECDVCERSTCSDQRLQEAAKDFP